MTDSPDASLWARARRWARAAWRGQPDAPPPEPEAAPAADLLPADTLTGLPNRDALMELLQQAIADSEALNEPLALLVLDVDRFKHVNQVPARSRPRPAGKPSRPVLSGP